MNSRIATIRKENNLNQQEFANRLGLTKNFISLLETGNREPSDRTISDICKAFKVNEEWLVHGTGEKCADPSREQLIAETVANVLNDKPGSFQERVIKLLASLTYEEKVLLENIINTLSGKEDEK